MPELNYSHLERVGYSVTCYAEDQSTYGVMLITGYACWEYWIFTVIDYVVIPKAVSVQVIPKAVCVRTGEYTRQYVQV